MIARSAGANLPSAILELRHEPIDMAFQTQGLQRQEPRPATDSLVERVGLLFDRFVPDDNEYAMIEATIICTHQASAGAKGGAPKQERSDAAKADRAASSTRYAMRLANLSLST
jgi:hypothetical protein